MTAWIGKKHVWAVSVATSLLVGACADADSNDWTSTTETTTAAQLEGPDGGATPTAPVAAQDAAVDAVEDLGKGDGRDVATIGDSWMSLGRTGSQQSLVEISGQCYRT